MRSTTALLITNMPVLDQASINYGDGTFENPCIVQDTGNGIPDLKNWRTLQTIMDDNDKQYDLWLSFSGAPSKLGWKEAAKNIDEITHHTAKRKVVVDLCQESHLYLNGERITHCTVNNWINVGKSLQQAVNAENAWIETFPKHSPVHVVSPDQFKSNNIKNGFTVIRDIIQTEKEVVEEQGFDYSRLGVSDHRGPSIEDIDQFIKVFDTLDKETWLHIHCRGGQGRCSTFAAIYLMLKFADKVSFDDIIGKIFSVPPNYDLSCLTHADPEIAQYRAIRYETLKNVYHFAQARLTGYTNTYSNWHPENLEKISADIVKHPVADKDAEINPYETSNNFRLS